jgi:DNA-binding CsgD family transcriptional regulator
MEAAFCDWWDETCRSEGVEDVRPTFCRRGLQRRRRLHQCRRLSGWSSLTGCELSVTEFVSLGFTNREIATQMSLSCHAVDSHLRHIFDKLGIGSRVQLVRVVFAQSPS